MSFPCSRCGPALVPPKGVECAFVPRCAETASAMAPIQTSELILIIVNDDENAVRRVAAARELDLRIPARPWWSIG